MTDLGTLGGASSFAIGDSAHAFLSPKGTMTLGMLGGANITSFAASTQFPNVTCFAEAINERGQVVGFSTTDTGDHMPSGGRTER